MNNNLKEIHSKWYSNLKYMLVGILFGIIFVKSDVISWFRIQEMFRLQSFHMYGIIGSAVLTGMISVWIIKKFNIKTIHGESISIAPKQFNKGQIYGGLLFWLRMGYYRCMSGTFVCTNRHRCYRYYCYIAKCNSRNMGIWIDKEQITTLI